MIGQQPPDVPAADKPDRAPLLVRMVRPAGEAMVGVVEDDSGAKPSASGAYARLTALVSGAVGAVSRIGFRT